jgi:hypothetical protein
MFIFIFNPTLHISTSKAGISAARNAKIRTAKMAWLNTLQTTLDSLPGKNTWS